jgi:Tfp pilus assembly protein PilF
MMKKLMAMSAIALITVSAAAASAAEDIERYKQFCNLATRDPLQAIDNCTKIIENGNPKDLRDAYTQRGRGFLVHGWLEKALADFNAALRLDPKWGTAYNNRAVAYRQLGRFQEALADHDRAISMEKNNDLFIRARENTLKKMSP